MKVQRKTNPDYLRGKNERPEERTRQLKIRTFETQENIKENQSNILLEQNEKRRERICKRMSNLSTGTDI